MTVKAVSFVKDIISPRVMMTWAGTLALLIVSAKVQIPMVPVPITLQTAVVLALPCLFGWRMTLSSIGSYLALGFLGAPVFAIGALAGPAYFLGPTGGYLIGFIIAAYLTGKIYDALENKGIINLTGLMAAGHGLILSLGTLWLAFGVPSMGGTAAIAAGFMPFLAGSLVKSLMVAAFIKAFQK